MQGIGEARHATHGIHMASKHGKLAGSLQMSPCHLDVLMLHLSSMYPLSTFPGRSHCTMHSGHSTAKLPVSVGIRAMHPCGSLDHSQRLLRNRQLLVCRNHQHLGKDGRGHQGGHLLRTCFKRICLAVWCMPAAWLHSTAARLTG